MMGAINDPNLRHAECIAALRLLEVLKTTFAALRQQFHFSDTVIHVKHRRHIITLLQSLTTSLGCLQSDLKSTAVPRHPTNTIQQDSDWRFWTATAPGTISFRQDIGWHTEKCYWFLQIPDISDACRTSSRHRQPF
jgi:hypothetical protein